MDYISFFLFSSNLRTFVAFKTLFWRIFISNGLLAQSVERGANNGKVMCSRLVWTITFSLDCFLFLSSLHTFVALKRLT